MASPSPKRAKYSTKDDGTNESEYLKSLEAIETFQDELNIMKNKFSQDVFKLVYKLEIDMKPIYDKREEALSRIPNFWADALMNHPKIAALLDESEEKYLLYLSKIEVQTVEEESTFSFKIIFHFKENPYFKNTSLIKKYVRDYESSEVLKNEIPNTIIWKDGQDISQKLKERKSFLFWLTSQDFGNADNDIAEVITEDLWMCPQEYYPYFVLSDNKQEDSSDEDEDKEDDVPIFEDSDEEESENETEAAVSVRNLISKFVCWLFVLSLSA